MTFESCGNLVVLWCPAIWSADAEFVSVMVLLSIISSSPLCLVSAEALVVEHERESEWLKVLHDNETSDLAFNKRSVSFEANKLWRLPLKIFWNLIFVGLRSWNPPILVRSAPTFLKNSKCPTIIISKCTVVFSQNRTLAILWSKMAFFTMAWREVKVLPRLSNCLNPYWPWLNL